MRRREHQRRAEWHVVRRRKRRRRRHRLSARRIYQRYRDHCLAVPDLVGEHAAAHERWHPRARFESPPERRQHPLRHFLHVEHRRVVSLLREHPGERALLLHTQKAHGLALVAAGEGAKVRRLRRRLVRLVGAEPQRPQRLALAIVRHNSPRQTRARREAARRQARQRAHREREWIGADLQLSGHALALVIADGAPAHDERGWATLEPLLVRAGLHRVLDSNQLALARAHPLQQRHARRALLARRLAADPLCERLRRVERRPLLRAATRPSGHTQRAKSGNAC
eukprot:557298-Pleurochrysis_carterae.AAC.1